QFGPPVSSPVAAIDVARFGDFDADGFDDLVTLAGGDVTVRLSDGAGGLLPGVPTPVPDNVMDVGVADWNGDGDQDVVVLTYSVPKGFDDYKRWIGVLPGDGAGGLAPPPGMFLYDVDYPHPPDRLKLGDVNGDGKPDAVVIESFPGQLRVVLGDGAVWFTAGPALWDGMLSNTGEDSMALADLDGDGALDIVARRSGQIRAWSGHGDGTFAASVTLTTTVPQGGRSVAVDDVDRDGFADVVFDTYSRFGVLHGSAGGGFEPADYARPATSPSGRIFVGSLDGDAFPDVLGVETDGALWPNEPKFPGLSTHRNLAASAQWADLGYGLAGTNGVPKLVGTGTLEAGSPGTLKLSNAHPNKLAVLFISEQSNPAPFKGGILATVPPLISFMLFTNPAGAISLSWSSWPGGAPGSTWYFQYGVVDPGGPAGAALSNALRATQP
ncbi:MAG TPA: VCBS repeat-containing protein, partial [Ilumatobacteraceae bacterium]|nr:VCBS repeat-containing protein [Ilumatobacteraceae bacterium]